MNQINDKRKLVILQNYMTPYRERFFHEVGKDFDLTVVYLHKPEDEGRKWSKETHGIKDQNFKELQLSYRKIGPVIWNNNIKPFKDILTKDTILVVLDNLPTNFSVIRMLFSCQRIVPPAHRILWEEQIPPFGGDSFIKIAYKNVVSWLLAFFVENILVFSDMAEEYLNKLRLPHKWQHMGRTLQTVYTQAEIKQFATVEHESHSGITFGFLGYFSKRKGLPAYLKAMKFYTSPHARFIFVGDGPERASIAAAAKVDSRITLLPYAQTEDEKSAAFAKMDVHVVPSEKDPWCLVVNEAAARGVPTLVSPYVGAKQLMKEISDDFELFENDPVSLAHAFHDLELVKRTKPIRWKKIVAKTYEVAKEYSLETAAKQVKELIDRMTDCRVTE